MCTAHDNILFVIKTYDILGSFIPSHFIAFYSVIENICVLSETPKLGSYKTIIYVDITGSSIHLHNPRIDALAKSV